MFDALLVTWRESAEALLIIALLREYALRSGRRDMPVLIRRGLVLASVLTALCVAAIISFAAEPAFDALLTIAAAIGVLLMATGMAASARGIDRKVAASIDNLIDTPGASMALVSLVSLLVLRESLEMFIFLRAISQDIGAATTLTGAGLGLLAAALTTRIWAWARARFGLLAVFRISAVLLLALAVRLLIQGLEELLQTQWLPIDHGYWLEAAAPIMDGGPWHTWFYAALLLPPLLYFMKTWWRETDWVDPDQQTRLK